MATLSISPSSCAGPVPPGTLVTLSAPAGTTYQWTQIAGDTVVLSSATAQSPSFTPSSYGTYQFTCFVDGVGVTWIDCSGAGAIYVSIDIGISHNCSADPSIQTETLGSITTYVANRCGFSASIPLSPSLTSRFNSFVIDAQNLLYRRYDSFRNARFFTWNLEPGIRFYNVGTSAYLGPQWDASHVQWVGVSQNNSQWRPLVCGIPPELYTAQAQAIPTHYEVRRCIEVWPVPASSGWQLRILAELELQPFAAPTDVVTINADAVKLHALSRAKAYYGQPDARAVETDLQILIGDLSAETHLTRRYIPGTVPVMPAVRPKMV